MQGAALARLKREEAAQKAKLQAYEASISKELDAVIGYVTRFGRRKEEGSLEALDEATLADWRRKLDELEKERGMLEAAKKEEEKEH